MMEGAQNGTTAFVSECRVNNIRHFVTTIMMDITSCNGYVIAARGRIQKPPKVKCPSHGAR